MKDSKYRFYYTVREAKKRGISFELTQTEWYEWWLQNGVDKNLSTKMDADQLCMCRYNDTGSYRLDNIYLGTRSQNMKDAHKNNCINYTKKFKRIKTPAGFFESRKAAAKHFGVAEVTVSSWVKKYPTEYSYQV